MKLISKLEHRPGSRFIPLPRGLPTLFLATALALLVPALASAQGGPPFRTDDPETPGNKQWEINLGLIGTRTVSEGSYSTPNIDVNYGLGNRIQLKYELPLDIKEWRGSSPLVAAGLGNSLLGVKWRFFETRTETTRPGKSPEAKFSFALSTYPQLVLNNPTRSVRREIADPGPLFLLPIEANATIGPLRIVGEVGYWFAANATRPPLQESWIRGVIIGHEFRSKTELYLELHDEPDVDAITRESTIGIGGRQPVARQGKILFLWMVGRSLQATTPTNGQPDWIAYFGLQFQLGAK